MQSTAVLEAVSWGRRRGRRVLHATGPPLLVASTLTGCGQLGGAAPRCLPERVTASRGERRGLGEASVARDGSFTTTLEVPADASPGEAAITISGSPYDEPCDDTNGSAASCAIYDVSIVLAPPVGTP